MPDREKVITALEKALAASKAVDSGFIWITVGEGRKALELLKEQDGVPYVFDADGETACGVCGYQFGKAYGNCPQCGKKVDWNA